MVSRDEVLKIADLAKLQFGEAELDAFTSQFQRILEYVEKLEEVSVEGIEPTSHVSLAEKNEGLLFRDDEARSSFTSELSLANAPDSARDHFRVPKVI